MLLLFIDTKCTIYLGKEHYDIFYFKTKQLANYQIFFLIYFLKSWLTVQYRAMNKTNIYKAGY